MDEEKELALKFFKTSIGKATLAKLKSEKESNSIIIELNKKIQSLEARLQGVQIPEIEDEGLIQEQLNKAVSLFKSERKPQYLFGITNEFGETKGVYTTQLENIRKDLAYEENAKQEENIYG